MLIATGYFALTAQGRINN